MHVPLAGQHPRAREHGRRARRCRRPGASSGGTTSSSCTPAKRPPRRRGSGCRRWPTPSAPTSSRVLESRELEQETGGGGPRNQPRHALSKDRRIRSRTKAPPASRNRTTKADDWRSWNTSQPLQSKGLSRQIFEQRCARRRHTTCNVRSPALNSTIVTAQPAQPTVICKPFRLKALRAVVLRRPALTAADAIALTRAILWVHARTLRNGSTYASHSSASLLSLALWPPGPCRLRGRRARRRRTSWTPRCCARAQRAAWARHGSSSRPPTARRPTASIRGFAARPAGAWRSVAARSRTSPTRRSTNWPACPA